MSQTPEKSMHTLLVVHEQSGVHEVEAPGESPDDAMNSEVVLQKQDELIDKHGGQSVCIVLPADASPNHPLVTAVAESMPSVSLAEALRER